VKVLQAMQASKERENFFREADLQMQMAPHPNVLRCWGMCTVPECAIVSEYVALGALWDVLRSLKSNGGKMEVQQRLKVVRGIAAGMAHLHSIGIIHRDLSARNVLLAEDYEAKVADFGLSRVLAMADHGYTKTRTGPLRWMAPESITKLNYSVKSDAWAFGITLFEIYTSEQPYSELSAMDAAGAVAFKGLRLHTPADMEPTVAEVMQSCLHSAPQDRPDFSKIFAMLQNSKGTLII